MNHPDVVIIGGGVIGASVAYHLTQSGMKNILVVDKAEKPGDGSTGKATGGFRCQFASKANIQLSLLSRSKLFQFKDEIGVDPGFQQYGYLFIAQNEREISSLREAKILQHQCGVTEVQEVNPSEIHELSPSISITNVIGGMFSPSDGFIRPSNIMNGYIKVAQRRNVEFRYGEEIIASEKDQNGTILSVKTSKKTIHCGAVVNAAGAWAGNVAMLFGTTVPVHSEKRHVAVVKEKNLLPETTPMTIFVGDGFHFRMRDGNLLMLLPGKNPVKNKFETNTEESWFTEIEIAAKRSLPLFSRHEIARSESWAGLYEMSPDKHAILGADPAIKNFYYVNGSSGHGVMHSPALGQLLSEIITGQRSGIDITPFRPERFNEGKMNPTTDYL